MTALVRRLLAGALLSVGLWTAAIAAPADNLLVQENGVRLVGTSSSYGGWEADNMVPSLARLAEPGVTLQDFIWCTADGAPFPHWVVFDLGRPQWLTTLVFNNVLKDEPAYPGISARQVEVWAGLDSADALHKVASFELERNKAGQSVRIEPLEARWLKFVVTGNWGHPTWTEMNASAAYDDGSRPADVAGQLDRTGKVDLYGIYFDFASATLRAESTPTLAQILAYHRSHPDAHLVIEGHTDNVGGNRYNDELATPRRRCRHGTDRTGSRPRRLRSGRSRRRPTGRRQRQRNRPRPQPPRHPARRPPTLSQR